MIPVITDLYQFFHHSAKFLRKFFTLEFNFLETTKQIPSEQYGFQKKKSTVDALLTHVEKIRNFLDGKIKVSSVFLDLRKAFDTVDHGILLMTLENAGI